MFLYKVLSNIKFLQKTREFNIYESINVKWIQTVERLQKVAKIKGK